MDIRKISPGLSVSPQVSVQDIAVLAGKGFKGIINVRPDEEEHGARAFLLSYRHTGGHAVGAQ